MAKQTQTPYERAILRAEAEGIRIVADFGSHWRVRGSDGVTLYRVTQTDAGLACSCQSRHYCKHLAVCQRLLNERQAEREAAVAETLAEMHAPVFDTVGAWERYYEDLHAWNEAALAETAAAEALAAEASEALVLAERSERGLSGAALSQERALLVAAVWPVTSLLLAGQAGQRLVAEREARWSRYQAWRMSQ